MNDTDLANLELTLDDREIFNDLRVMIPRYGHYWKQVGETTVITWYDLNYQSLDSESVDRYGRRTKLQKFHVMDASFAEACTENSKQKFHDPLQQAKARVIGKDAARILTCLTSKISDSVHLENTASGVDNDYWIDRLTLDLRPDRIELELHLKETDALQIYHWFHIGTDLIDGEHRIA